MLLSGDTIPISNTTVVADVLDRAAASHAELIAIDRELTARHVPYRELAQDARRAAGTLRAKGVRPGDRVCMLSSTSPELVAALFGAWRAGAVPVILSLPRRQSELGEYVIELERRVRHVGARLLLVADALGAVMPPTDAATVVQLGELDQPAVEPLGDHEVELRGDDLAYLQFTSGSTGQSRAVALTHRQILTNVDTASAALELTPGDRLISWLPLFHDMGLLSLLASMAGGMTAVIEPTEEFLASPGSWMEAVSRFQGTFTFAPNFAYALASMRLRNRPDGALKLSQLRVAGNGAEPIDADTLDQFLLEAGRQGLRAEAICPMYGMAEATVAVSMSRPGEPMQELWAARTQLGRGAAVRTVDPGAPDGRRLVACGRPIPMAEVAIRDEHGNDLGEGRVGEICVRSPSIMEGYWEEPSATSEALRDGWLQTGDLGFWDRGEVVICGRIKDIIIVGGRNLYPEDYEQWTTRVSGVRRGNAIAFGLEQEERMVVVAETTTSGPDADRVARQAMHTLRRRLPQAPQEVVLVAKGTLPKTSSGKLQRRLCRQRYREGTLPVIATARRA